MTSYTHVQPQKCQQYLTNSAAATVEYKFGRLGRGGFGGIRRDHREVKIERCDPTDD